MAGGVTRLLRRSTDPDRGEQMEGQLELTDTLVKHRAGRAQWLRFVLIGTVLALVILGSSAGYLAWSNKARADDWEARSEQLENTAAELDRSLDSRTKTLNERTVELNGLAEKVADAEVAIERSEADVKRLERRQRQLAAEKADVEDAEAALALQTNAIEGVAAAYVRCKGGLTTLLQYVLAEDYLNASVIAPSVESDCSNADSALQSYLADYG